jgi:DNA-binding transcriptional ArsR family regulator
VEDILGSKGRIRVLKVLSKSRELNISEIGRRTGLNYSSVDRHLEKLEELGLVREKRYGKIRIFEILFRNLDITFERDKGIKLSITSLQT